MKRGTHRWTNETNELSTRYPRLSDGLLNFRQKFQLLLCVFEVSLDQLATNDACERTRT